MLIVSEQCSGGLVGFWLVAVVCSIYKGVFCMRHLRLIMAALAALFALSALMAVTAFALPTILGEVSTFTGKKATGSGEALLVKANGEEVNCKEAKGSEGTLEANHHLGLFHIAFEKCTTASGLVTCTGLADNSGVILSLGSWHLVYDSLAVSLVNDPVAILFLVGTVHFECAGQLVVVPLGGMVLCLILNPTALTKVFEFHCNKASGANRPEETKYYNEGGTLVAISALLSAKNEGTFEESTEVALGTIEYPLPALIMT
jgi:hypothetical protein